MQLPHLVKRVEIHRIVVAEGRGRFAVLSADVAFGSLVKMIG